MAGVMPMSESKRYDEFVGLVRLHTTQILAYINALLLNWNDAEDLFQETCVVLWQKFDDFEPGTNFLAWALRIADRKVMNFQTTQSRRTAFAAGLRDAMMADVSHVEADQAAADLSALSGCMEKLPQNDRKIVTLCYAEGEAVSRVADALGRSPQSVHNSLRRIRNWLLECIRRELKQTDAPAPFHRGLLKEDDGT
jgi:RNA polymerase sigma-70 factor, ECF subfamily